MLGRHCHLVASVATVLPHRTLARHVFCRSSLHQDAQSEDSGTEKPKNWPRLARDAEPEGGSRAFSKVQRGALGGVGATLAAAGLGGYAWLHWPLLGPTHACVIACSAGTALLALAAKGELPQPKSDRPKTKRLLELKLLNDDMRMKAEHDALKKIQAPRSWPTELQATFANADKRTKVADEAAKAARQQELLVEVRSQLDAGVTSDALRSRLRPRLFVFDFNPSGDGGVPRPQGTKSQLELLRTAISFVLSSASAHDEVLLRLTSPGGAVAPYGFAASQLQRLRDADVHLTICVDTVAASGGYMMACIANRVVAAPFSSIGSIGVLAGVPNFHRVLDRNEVEFTQVTGGKYKRTVNVLTPNTPEGLAKFRQDVDDIHGAFKGHVAQWRPNLDIEEVATGEVWLGASALERGLVDAIGTSDEEIRIKVAEGFDAIELTLAKNSKQGLAKLLDGVGGAGAEFAQTAAHHATATIKSVCRRLLRGECAEIRVESTRQ